jgi:hypothetical protein
MYIRYKTLEKKKAQSTKCLPAQTKLTSHSSLLLSKISNSSDAPFGGKKTAKKLPLPSPPLPSPRK